MSKGATYHDQAILSIISYPYLFKLFLAPFLDTFYFKRFGKSKTYITISGILVVIGLLFSMTKIDRQIAELRIKEIASHWFLLNLSIVFFQISAESWCLTLLKKDQKAKGSVMLSIGLSIGVFLTVNVFIPLNSKDWLNSHFYKKFPLKKGLITARQMLAFMALFILLTTVYVTFFVAEKRFTGAQKMTCPKIWKFLKKILLNKNIFLFALYLTITNFFQTVVDSSISFKFIEKGFHKADLININTITTPFAILLLFFSTTCMFKNYLLRSRHLIIMIMFILSIYNFWTLLNYLENENSDLAYTRLFLSSMFGIISEFNFIFWYGFLNTILDEEMGATSITIFTSLNNASTAIPSTIGLKMVDVVSNYQKFGVTCYIAGFVVLMATFPLAKNLDKTRKSK